MLLPSLSLLASLAAHPHPDCTPCEKEVPVPRVPVTVVAVDKNIPQQVRAWAADGPAASHLAFYAETGGRRVPITPLRAMQLAGHKDHADALQLAHRFSMVPDGQLEDEFLVYLVRPLGLGPVHVDVWEAAGSCLLTATPAFWMRPMVNSGARWVFAPRDDELRSASGVTYRPTN